MTKKKTYKILLPIEDDESRCDHCEKVFKTPDDIVSYQCDRCETICCENCIDYDFETNENLCVSCNE